MFCSQVYLSQTSPSLGKFYLEIKFWKYGCDNWRWSNDNVQINIEKSFCLLLRYVNSGKTSKIQNMTSSLTFISPYSGFEKASKCKAFVYAWIMISYLLIGFDIRFFLCLSSVEAAKYSLALPEYILLGRIVWNGISRSVGIIYIQTIEEVARKYQSVVLKSQITELES